MDRPGEPRKPRAEASRRHGSFRITQCWLICVVMGGLITGLPAFLWGAIVFARLVAEGQPPGLFFALLNGTCCGSIGSLFGAAIGNVIDAFIRDYQEH
jgi:hypothetical protein